MHVTIEEPKHTQLENSIPMNIISFIEQNQEDFRKKDSISMQIKLMC